MEEINAKENLTRLIEQYRNLVFSICLKLTGDYFAAEDLTQDTFIAAYRSWKSFDGTSEKAWLCRIASNKCIDYNRALTVKEIPVEEEELHTIEADVRAGPLPQILNREIMEELEACCNSLSPPYDKVARMHFVESMPAKEIAEQTGVGLNTIKTRILRAREMLKKSFRKELLQE